MARRPNSPPHPDGDPTVVAGRNPVREALERGGADIEKVYVQRGAHGGAIHEIRQAAKAAGVPVMDVPPARLNRLAPGMTHQGVAAIAAAVAYADLGETLAALAPDPDAVKAQAPLLVALDGVEDPHNFGAIVRSAVASGAQVVIVPERGSAPLSATALKASAGTALRIPVCRVGNLSDTLHGLKERGYWVYGLAGETDEPIWSADWKRAACLVVGSEGQGLSPRVRQTCDAVYAIPMPGDAESLNASVAAGVALFAAVRQRGDAGA